MSGEYFCIEEIPNTSQIYGDYETKRSVYSPKTKRSQELRLHEIEGQLEVAETRCNTLKGQLDYMKRIYKDVGKSDNAQDQKSARKLGGTPRRIVDSNILTIPRMKRTNRETKEAADFSSLTSASSTGPSAPKKEHYGGVPMRQNSVAIGTDNSGAAVRTINNILTGITDSVNRLSELHAHLGDGHVRDRPNSSLSKKVKNLSIDNTSKGVEIINLMNKPIRPSDSSEAEIVCLSNDMNTKSSTTCKSKSLKKRTKHSNAWTSSKSKIQPSSGTINLAKNGFRCTARHVEKRTELSRSRPMVMDDMESTSYVASKRRKNLKRLKTRSKISIDKKRGAYGKHFEQFATDNLVELYHNTAIRGSDSDDSINKANYMRSRQSMKNDDGIPPLQINVMMCDPNKPADNSQRSLSPIEERSYSEPAAPRTDCYSTVAKNYELPTIASKMKQVAKNYLHTFNFRAIPFCAAKSTSPSHNIGINIQQVMSIMKTRQPINGISPTLAHNIGLVADRLHSRPLSDLVSTLSSKLTYGRSQCPLIKSTLNYQQLQEMAKDIPEDPAEETAMLTMSESKGINDIGFSGPSGDTRGMNQGMIWTVDPSHKRNCTCLGNEGLTFQQVLSKYSIATDFASSSQAQYMPFSRTNNKYRPPKTTSGLTVKKQREQVQRTEPAEPIEIKTTTTLPLEGKEKNLKEVLSKLHDEFEQLNVKYEILSKQVNNGDMEATVGTVKELELMEKDLNSKEEEIEMVIALYKEVMALKKQVKKLKQRASQASIAISQQPSRFREYKDPKAALHLTQLLRQIQNYQIHHHRREI